MPSIPASCLLVRTPCGQARRAVAVLSFRPEGGFMRRFSVGLLCVLCFVLVLPTQAQDQRCFPETTQCIGGRIRQFWEQNGGLLVFGYPITPQHEEQIEGKPFQVQW